MDEEQKPGGRNVGWSAGLEPLPQPTVLMRVMPDDHRYGDVMGYTAAQMRDYAAKCVAAERKACWDSVNAAIKRGPLQGSGWDESAERNGLVLASNIIMERIGSNAQPQPRSCRSGAKA